MNAKTNAQGKERKNLVKAIAEITGQAAKYNGAPAFTYTVGSYTVERDGSITTEEVAGMKNLRRPSGNRDSRLRCRKRKPRRK